MTSKTRTILARLDEKYTTEYRCSLNYSTPWELLVATILSAQCTDERVNSVTKDLFIRYPDVYSLAQADCDEVREYIKSLGFVNTKPKNIIGAAKIICDRFNGEVPSDIEKLIQLPGVGRKTANVIRGNIFHIPSVVVDTHVKRIAYRLEFTKNTDPDKIEQDLMRVLPKEHWILINIQLIVFGREICTARSPKCNQCFLNDICRSEDKIK